MGAQICLCLVCPVPSFKLVSEVSSPVFLSRHVRTVRSHIFVYDYTHVDAVALRVRSGVFVLNCVFLSFIENG